MKSKIGKHETTWHGLDGEGGPIKGVEPYETLKLKGVEFIIIGSGGGTLTELDTAKHALEYCQKFKRPGIKVVYSADDTERFVVVSPNATIGAVHQKMSAAFSDNKGNSADRDLDAVVARFLKKTDARVKPGRVGTVAKPDKPFAP